MSERERELTVHTDHGEITVEAARWEREDDGSRVFYDSDGHRVGDIDRENFIAVTEATTNGESDP